jgi:hypothetical protein
MSAMPETTTTPHLATAHDVVGTARAHAARAAHGEALTVLRELLPHAAPEQLERLLRAVYAAATFSAPPPQGELGDYWN